MNGNFDADRIVAAWLDDGPSELPDPTRQAIAFATRMTPQARGRFDRLAWRDDMTRFQTLGIVAAIAIVAVVGVVALAGGRPTSNVGAGTVPSASAVPTPSRSAAPSLSPLDIDIGSNWTSYRSSQYGLTIGHLRDWNVDPADRAWDLDIDAADWQSPAMDDFTAPGGDVRMSVWSVALEPGTILDDQGLEAWIERYCQKTGSASCAGILEGAVPLCVGPPDCQPGMLVGVAPPFDREVQAFFTGGIHAGRVVVVTVWREGNHPSLERYGGARRFMEGHLAGLYVWPAGDLPGEGSP